jgi:hypothetical protein
MRAAAAAPALAVPSIGHEVAKRGRFAEGDCGAFDIDVLFP